MRFALLAVLREALLRAVVTFLFAPRLEAALRVPDERARELCRLRAAVRGLRDEEDARDLRDLDPDVEPDERLDELRFDLPDARELEALPERAAAREELLFRERER